LELEAILEELRTDMKERFVRQEEFKDYKQSVRESLAFVDKKHEELKVTVTDHESRIAALETTLSQDLAAQLQSMAQGYTRFKQEQ
jgi:prefoldin subunit 5